MPDLKGHSVRLLLLFSLLALSGCSWKPFHGKYKQQYTYLNEPVPAAVEPVGSHYLVILVDARHLDYTDQNKLGMTINKNPSNGSKRASTGHAWLILYGDGAEIEGGHTTDNDMMGFIDSVQDAVEEKDPNPIRVFSESSVAGRFEPGTGDFSASFAGAITITPDQYRDIRQYIDEYDYSRYHLQKSQCCTFVRDAAKRAGIELETEVVIPVTQKSWILGHTLQLWTDPKYSKFPLPSPDILERSLRAAAREGRVTNVTSWAQDREPFLRPFEEIFDATTRFPVRATRFLLLRPE